MSTTHEFRVAMTCTGCSGAVEKVLGKLGNQIEKLEIDLEKQSVLVTSTLTADQLLETIKKTGKETTYIGIKSQ